MKMENKRKSGVTRSISRKERKSTKRIMREERTSEISRAFAVKFKSERYITRANPR